MARAEVERAALAALTLAASAGIPAATLPGAEWVLPLLCAPVIREAAGFVGDAMTRLGFVPGADLQGVSEGFASLSDDDARRAFLHTARSVMEPSGQRVDARDRLYLAADVPSLIVWGENDAMIPVAHGHAAHELMPNSRLDVFPGAGHFPFNDDPYRFSTLLHDFISSTPSANLDDEHVRRLLRERLAA